MKTANMLLLEDVVERGCNFLISNLKPNNCIGICHFAALQSCQKLQQIAHKYALVSIYTLISKAKYNLNIFLK